MDKEIFKYIKSEKKRQKKHIELIASENYVSKDVLKATGSILTNKYAEGYPFKRYYDGTENVDEIEKIAIERLKKLFNVKYANVQPHSGSQANSAAYTALLKPGDKIMGLSLEAGGHLTHGYKINFSGQVYHSLAYGVDKNGVIDYDQLEKLVLEYKPNLVVCGFSAYSRQVDFKRFREICDKVNAYLMADIAHIAGLVATGLHPSPVDYAHIITSTTHKTLRGARGGIIMTNDAEIAKKVDKSVFPGTQGGPLMHVIAGKAIAFKEALDPKFKTYIQNVVDNSKAFADAFKKLGAKVITDGTDTHLFIIDVKTSYNMTGKDASTLLHKNFITANKNTIPFDQESPMVSSGLRLGTAAMTSRGFGIQEFEQLAFLIDSILKNNQLDIKDQVLKLTKKFKIKKSY